MIVSAQQFKLWLLVLLFLITLSACAQMLETKRNVYFNGERQNALQASSFDYITGVYLPDGHYWHNALTGEWGIEGSDKVLGNTLINAAARNNSQRNANSGGGGGNSGSISASQNGVGGTGRDAEGRNCAFVSMPNGDGMMTCH